MKSMGDGAILKSKVVAPRECLRYALGLPTSVVITGIDNEEVLQQALGVMRGFTPFSQDELSELLQRTAPLATEGKFEPFKTSAHFEFNRTPSRVVGRAKRGCNEPRRSAKLTLSTSFLLVPLQDDFSSRIVVRAIRAQAPCLLFPLRLPFPATRDIILEHRFWSQPNHAVVARRRD